jgi:SAM-dependent methyltransferase
LLEVAAGTGIVTAALALALPRAQLIATDLNQPMLDHAATKPELRGVEFRQADALALPFDDQSFDAVVCQFGVMFFPDRVAAFREAYRVLKPGGQFVFNVWDSVAKNPIVAATLMGLSRLYPQHPSWFLERTPCGYRETDIIRADLAAGGFADCRIETVTLRGCAESPMSPAIGFCQGSPMRAELEALDPTGLEAATAAAAAAIAEQFGQGAFETELCALVIETRRYRDKAGAWPNGCFRATARRPGVTGMGAEQTPTIGPRCPLPPGSASFGGGAVDCRYAVDSCLPPAQSGRMCLLHR